MKTIRLYLFLLAVGVVIGAMQGPVRAAPLKNVNQICQIYYDTQTLTWKRVLPDGTVQDFTLSSGQSLVITGIYLRFYANTTDTGPYRFFLKAPNSTNLWIANLSNIQYPTTGSTVYGGSSSEIIDPGIRISVGPTWEVRQIPVPPNNPNSGSVISGTLYGRITGYVCP